MEFKVTPAPKIARRPVAYVSATGVLYMQFKDPRLPDQRNAVLGSSYGPAHHISVNGTGEVQKMIGLSDTPIYPGDSVTIKF